MKRCFIKRRVAAGIEGQGANKVFGASNFAFHKAMAWPTRKWAWRGPGEVVITRGRRHAGLEGAAYKRADDQAGLGWEKQLTRTSRGAAGQ